MSDALASLQAMLDGRLSHRERFRALEAGCGSLSNIRLGPKAYIVRIDISDKQLQKNTAIHEKILGDLQTYDFPEGTTT